MLPGVGGVGDDAPVRVAVGVDGDSFDDLVDGFVIGVRTHRWGRRLVERCG